MVGTTIEWYDFQLYGLSAALVFSQVFFPESSTTAGTLASFGVFALGFFARPLGGIIFGHFGDRIGRKNVLLVTLILMGFSTFAVALIPSFDSIGLWAPTLLILMRLLGGLALGGEWGGAVLLSVEHAPSGRRGLYGALPQMGSPAGFLVATTVFTIVTASMSEEAFLDWGWRIPFLLSGALVVVGLYIRARVEETPVFLEQEGGEQRKVPIVQVFRKQRTTVFLAIGAFALSSGGYYVYATYMVSYATKTLGVATTVMAISGIVFSIGGLTGAITAALISDRIGRRPVFMTVAVFTIVYAYPLFWLVQTQNSALIWIALAFGGLANGSVYGLMGSIMVEIFEPSVRYTGASLGQQVSAGLVGGTTPLIVTALVASAGSVWPAPTWLIVLGLVSLICVFALPETFKRDIYGNYGTPIAHKEPALEK
ncbi:UNVERIFIED_ORG: putative MFS family arabinose efflux permease [Gordonia westfalica J30]